MSSQNDELPNYQIWKSLRQTRFNSYDEGIEWNDLAIDSSARLIEELWKLVRGGTVICRGQSLSDWGLQPGIDRVVPRGAKITERLDEEQQLIEEFRSKARNLVGPLERAHLEPDDSNKFVLSMTLMQHYGGPTRLLDWTESPWVAAFFAVLDNPSGEGAIWWVRDAALTDALEQQWKTPECNEFERDDDGEIDLNFPTFTADCPEFICRVRLRIPFGRASAQQGLFTIAGPLGLPHHVILSKLLNKRDYGRVLIPNRLKISVLNDLKLMNVDSSSLQHAGADRLGILTMNRFLSSRRPVP